MDWERLRHSATSRATSTAADVHPLSRGRPKWPIGACASQRKIKSQSGVCGDRRWG